jgi:hypothetical protein
VGGAQILGNLYFFRLISRALSDTVPSTPILFHASIFLLEGCLLHKHACYHALDQMHTFCTNNNWCIPFSRVNGFATRIIYAHGNVACTRTAEIKLFAFLIYYLPHAPCRHGSNTWKLRSVPLAPVLVASAVWLQQKRMFRAQHTRHDHSIYPAS